MRRAHLVSERVNGSILLELYSRLENAGHLMVCRDIYEGIRIATQDDIPGVENLITPLVEKAMPSLPAILRRSKQRTAHNCLAVRGSTSARALVPRPMVPHRKCG